MRTKQEITDLVHSEFERFRPEVRFESIMGTAKVTFYKDKNDGRGTRVGASVRQLQDDLQRQTFDTWWEILRDKGFK